MASLYCVSLVCAFSTQGRCYSWLVTEIYHQSARHTVSSSAPSDEVVSSSKPIDLASPRRLLMKA